MNPEDLNQRLSRISTLWTLFEQAHAGKDDAAAAARQELLQRYCGAVYYYLLGALHDEDAAAELFQEFGARFVAGKFHRANPERGRFRDYLKTALINLVRDYRRAQRDRPAPLPADVPAPEVADEEFEENWREGLVTRAWAALAAAHPTFYAVLAFRAEHPDVPSSAAAQQLAGQLGKPLTATWVRVTQHRGSDKLEDLLLDEVLHSLENPTDQELLEELRQLRLLQVCEPAMRRRGRSL